MSMLNPRAKSSDLGEVIASTRDYEVAQKTVSKLIAGEVPARDIAIVGEGVRTVERVTGKLGYAAAARSGVVPGLPKSPGACACTRMPSRRGTVLRLWPRHAMP